ncbi:hypothetical protein JCM9279_002558 [Rhodotorula babjevae]
MATARLVDVQSPVPGIQILYDFINEAEEAYLLEKIDAAGGGTAAASTVEGEGKAVGGAAARKPSGWKDLNGRKSMYWGGTVLPSGSLVPSPFPAFMDGAWPNVLDRIAQLGVYDAYSGGEGKGKERGPNHCLVNEYQPGEGIMPHTDGPAYHPLTSTLSLGSHTILCLRSPPSHLAPPSRPSSTSNDAPSSSAPDTSAAPAVQKLDILLPPRSLVLLSGDLYSTWLHGIQPLKGDSLEALRGCANWEGWWAWQREAAVAAAASEGEGEGEGEGGASAEEAQAAAQREVQKARELVEAGKGWERGRRVSLTCRRPKGKVRAGLLGLR